ncbi:hypothetical protein [Pseudomonas sp. RIT-PI-AD]|uniref:hypothetical protein n=1 Tax=Pseudomonas sp. RIT-PI-AD TaxID=3035294 RepID=UPI0021DAB45D|nr:hypothetical protein [Pseudomonas sp. RIT-PI-AD]
MSPALPSGTRAEALEHALAPLRHPALEQAVATACAPLPVREAYLAALRVPVLGARLLLAVSGADISTQRLLAACVAEVLPEELELDLIELSEDALSHAVRERCEAFYRA